MRASTCSRAGAEPALAAAAGDLYSLGELGYESESQTITASPIADSRQDLRGDGLVQDGGRQQSERGRQAGRQWDGDRPLHAATGSRP